MVAGDAKHQLSEPPCLALSEEPTEASSASGLQGAWRVRLKGGCTYNFCFQRNQTKNKFCIRLQQGQTSKEKRHPCSKVPNSSSALKDVHRLETAGKLGEVGWHSESHGYKEQLLVTCSALYQLSLSPRSFLSTSLNDLRCLMASMHCHFLP